MFEFSLKTTFSSFLNAGHVQVLRDAGDAFNVLVYLIFCYTSPWIVDVLWRGKRSDVNCYLEYCILSQEICHGSLNIFW